EALDGRDLFSGGGAQRRDAASDGRAIEQHGAGAALAFAAAVLGAGEIKLIAQNKQEASVGGGFDGEARPVDLELNVLRHRTPPIIIPAPFNSDPRPTK